MATVIGEQTFIDGNLQGEEDLTVQGRLKGTVSSSRSLIVEPSGIVEAQVEVANAVISGIVVGNISATDAVELQAGGRMVGDIVAPRVIIVDGAAFRGNIDMGEPKDMPKRVSPPREAPRPAFVSRPKPPPAPAKVTKSETRAKPARATPSSARGGRGRPAPKPPRPGLKKKKKKILLKKKRR